MTCCIINWGVLIDTWWNVNYKKKDENGDLIHPF